MKLKEVMTSNSKIYLVLEFIAGGELYDLIKRKGKLDESACRKYFIQLIRALGHCKRHTIAHRDIKPENLLIDSNGDLKVSDFGLSSLFKDPVNLNLIMQTPCGTVNYIAPEVIQNSGYDGHIADIWSAGVLLFVCCTGRMLDSPRLPLQRREHRRPAREDHRGQAGLPEVHFGRTQGPAHTPDRAQLQETNYPRRDRRRPVGQEVGAANQPPE